MQHLARDPQKVKMYSDIIIEQEKRVFIERVTHPETTVGTCDYLLHHAVFKESATTSIRVLHQCSCRQSQEHPSLNESLLPGPPVTIDLTAIPSLFPRQEYGFATDIEKDFLNIKLDEQDRDATCFFCLVYIHIVFDFATNCTDDLIQETFLSNILSSSQSALSQLKWASQPVSQSAVSQSVSQSVRSQSVSQWFALTKD